MRGGSRGAKKRQSRDWKLSMQSSVAIAVCPVSLTSADSKIRIAPQRCPSPWEESDPRKVRRSLSLPAASSFRRHWRVNSIIIFQATLPPLPILSTVHRLRCCLVRRCAEVAACLAKVGPASRVAAQGRLHDTGRLMGSAGVWSSADCIAADASKARNGHVGCLLAHADTRCAHAAGGGQVCGCSRGGGLPAQHKPGSSLRRGARNAQEVPLARCI